MRETDKSRVMDLLSRLEKLDSQTPAPEEEPVHTVAKRAIMDEISQLVQRDWLAVYRNGDLLDAVSLA